MPNFFAFESSSYALDVGNAFSRHEIITRLPFNNPCRVALLRSIGSDYTDTIFNHILPFITKPLSGGLTVAIGFRFKWDFVKDNPNLNIIQTSKYCELDDVLKLLKSNKHNVLFIEYSETWFHEGLTVYENNSLLDEMWAFILELYPTNIIIDELLHFHPVSLGSVSARFNDFDGALYIILYTNSLDRSVVNIPINVLLESFETLLLLEPLGSTFPCSVIKSL